MQRNEYIPIGVYVCVFMGVRIHSMCVFMHVRIHSMCVFMGVRIHSMCVFMGVRIHSMCVFMHVRIHMSWYNLIDWRLLDNTATASMNFYCSV